MAKLSYSQAIRETIAQEMRRDERVFKYYWRELLHLSSAVDQKVQRGVSDDYRKILQRDFAAIPRIHNQRPDVPYLSYQQKDLLVFIGKRSCAEHR